LVPLRHDFGLMSGPLTGGAWTWNEEVTVPVLWTPQHTEVPHLIVRVSALPKGVSFPYPYPKAWVLRRQLKEKGVILGVGEAVVGSVAIPVPPFVLHALQPMEHLYPVGPKGKEQSIGVRLRVFYMPHRQGPEAGQALSHAGAGHENNGTTLIHTMMMTTPLLESVRLPLDLCRWLAYRPRPERGVPAAAAPAERDLLRPYPRWPVPAPRPDRSPLPSEPPTGSGLRGLDH
jgi:hypothetical protein